MTAFTEHRYTSQDGLSLYYRAYGPRAGGKIPCVCLPGLTRNSKDFHSLAARLGRERLVLCPDIRGRGESDYDSDWKNYAAPVYLNDIKHLLTVAGVHRAIFIGTSMGGILSAAMMAAAPMVVAGVVLNDVGPDIERGGLARIVDYIGTDRPQPDLDSAAKFLKAQLPNLTLADEAAWRDFADATYRRGRDGVYHYNWDLNLVKPILQAGEDAVPDLWPVFRAVGRVPALTLRGEKSDVLSAETFERMGKEIAGLVRVTVAGIGHAPTLTEPVSADAIDALLARADGIADAA